MGEKLDARRMVYAMAAGDELTDTQIINKYESGCLELIKKMKVADLVTAEIISDVKGNDVTVYEGKHESCHIEEYNKFRIENGLVE